MTWEQYWYGETWMVRAFRKADELKQRRINENLWLQGRYVYDALLCVSPIMHAFAGKDAKPIPYHEKPYPITADEQEEERKKREELELIQADIYMDNFVRFGQNWGKE